MSNLTPNEVFSFLTRVIDKEESAIVKQLRGKYVALHLNDFVDGTKKSKSLEKEITLIAQEVLENVGQ